MADLDMKPKLRAHGTAARLMKTGSKSSSSATKSASEARSSATAIPVEPFHFRKRRDNINWRSLAAVDITKIVRNADVTVLQEILQNITFCDIESEDLRYVDPNFIKLFQLAQLIIEYLLYSQEFLEAKRGQADASSKSMEDQLELIKELERKHECEVEVLSKENRQLKKTVYAYQLWTKTPGGLNNSQPVATEYHRCRYCTKVFNSDYYLESHLTRRHPDRPNYIAEMQNLPPVANVQPPQKNDADMIEKITSTIERYSDKLVETERVLRAEMEGRLAQEVAKRERIMEEGYRNEKSHLETQLRDLKEMMTRQLEEERQLLREERVLFEASRKKMAGSNIGNLEDTEDAKKRRFEEDLMRKIDSKYNEAFGKFQSVMEKVGSTHLDQEKHTLEKVLRDTTKKLEHLESSLSVSAKRSYPTLDLWPVYRTMLDSFSVPLPRNNLVKTKYEHKANELTSKRREAEARFGLDLQKRGISEEVAATTEGRAHIESVVRKERDHLDSKSPYYAKLRTYLMDQVDQSVKQAFKLKPFGAPVPKATANFIPVPDKTTYFPVLHSPPTLYSPTRSARSIHSEVDWEKLASSDDSDDDQSVHSAVETVESETASVKKNKNKNVFAKAFGVFKRQGPKSATSIPSPTTPSVASPREDTLPAPTVAKPDAPSVVKVSSALELDPSLAQAIGHVPEAKSKKSPLEMDEKKGEDDFDVSDISDSSEEDNAPESPVDDTKLRVIKVDPAINSDDSRTEDISELLREVQSDFSASPAKAKTASSSNMLDEDSFDADDLNL